MVHRLIPILAVVVGVGAVLIVSYLHQPEAPAPRTAPPGLRVPPRPRPSAFGWHLVSATSAERMLVLEVETARPWEAIAIAQQLVEPDKPLYDEVLVFFFEPDARPRLAARRVQWTRAGGYRTLELNHP